MGEGYPTLNQIINEGSPPEWLPFVIVAVSMVLAIITLDIWTIMRHKKYSTKQPIQFISTIGILQVYPVFALMHLIGLIIPNANDVTVFITESYEALSFVFFLRLVLIYMGGKKVTKEILKGSHVNLNVTPICCLFCLPSVKFTRKFYVFCEVLIAIYVFFCIVAGLIELLMLLDGGKGYPSDMITGKFGTVYHIVLPILLLFAIYGLSAIYHTAQDRLNTRGIVKKFLVYKVFTILAKVLDLVFAYLVKLEVIEDFGYLEIWSTGLRVKNIVGFVICAMAFITFPLAIKFYSVKDYSMGDLDGRKNRVPVKIVQNVEIETSN